jgi:hypothetical protein
MALLGGVSGASASILRAEAIDPGTPVNGMTVAQGLQHQAKVGLFTDRFCDPVVLRPGQRTRSCRPVPRARSIFAGYGIFGPKNGIDSAWNRLSWAMWIDGQRVSLSRFGHSDRWLYRYPPADFRDVVLREWSILLIGAEGRHAIRYRTRLPQGVFDTTWKFSVGRSP